MSQHDELTVERWTSFTLGQQILQIGVEMHRASRFVRAGRKDLVRTGYERVFRLVDLTVEVQRGANLRRELLRWRSLVGELYVSEDPDPELHRLALRALLQLHPESALQVTLLGI